MGCREKKKWMGLAEPLSKYDPQVVCEFYVNAWTRGQWT